MRRQAWIPLPKGNESKAGARRSFRNALLESFDYEDSAWSIVSTSTRPRQP